MIELSWIASSPASALAAARVLVDGGRSVDAKTTLVEPAVEHLAALLDALDVPRARFFDEAIPLAIHYETPPLLAARLTARLFGATPDPLVESRLSACLAELQTAWQSAHPQAVAELELRAEPLRQQWEAPGPGLLANLARLTERGLLVERADVILLLPVAGGAGSSHWSHNAVAIEAVLANPIAALPEVVRLAWLLAQLNFDLPSLGADLSPSRISKIGPLAMIPPVLAAAEEVELTRYDAQRVATALDAWQAPPADAETLVAWWETYQASRPPWPVALAALERMLS